MTRDVIERERKYWKRGWGRGDKERKRDRSTPHVAGYKSTLPNKLWMIYSLYSLDIRISPEREFRCRCRCSCSCGRSFQKMFPRSWWYVKLLFFFSLTFFTRKNSYWASEELYCLQSGFLIPAHVDPFSLD